MEINVEVQFVACTAPDGAPQFFMCKKNQEKAILMKIGILHRLRRNLTCGTHPSPLKSCHEHGNQCGSAIRCMHSSRWCTTIFHVQEKSRKIDFDENWHFASFATQPDVRHASKPSQIVSRAWKSMWKCNSLHAQLPMVHHNFSCARKIKKNRF